MRSKRNSGEFRYESSPWSANNVPDVSATKNADSAGRTARRPAALPHEAGDLGLDHRTVDRLVLHDGPDPGHFRIGRRQAHSRCDPADGPGPRPADQGQLTTFAFTGYSQFPHTSSQAA